MQKICDFKINGKVYNIYHISEIEGKKSYVGKSEYNNREIFIECNSWKQMLLTLKHELMHVWLYENGHKNQGGKEIFGYEDVCELVALSNNFINQVVKKYCESLDFFYG